MAKKVAIIGAGPSGCACAYYSLKNPEIYVDMYDYKPILSTILPTGNGRCNFAYGEFDFKSLASFYPRGEKFLYSVFSQYSTADTLAFFDEIGIETYMQDDLRYFPLSNSSREIQQVLSNKLLKNRKFKYIKEKIQNIEEIRQKYDYVVIATGSNPQILNELISLNISTIPFKQALVALKIQETYLFQIPGVVLKNVTAKFKNYKLCDDFLITHKTLSGPLMYKISSLMAFEDFPYSVFLNFTQFSKIEDFSKYFENFILENNNKNFINIVSEIVPNSFAQMLFMLSKTDKSIKCHQVSKEIRQKFIDLLFNFKVTVVSTQKDGETVKAGGVNTDFINPKTMMLKDVNNLFVIGEMLNVDGFCGGFNLQNCWSTGAICGKYLADI